MQYCPGAARVTICPGAARVTICPGVVRVTICPGAVRVIWGVFGVQTPRTMESIHARNAQPNYERFTQVLASYFQYSCAR